MITGTPVSILRSSRQMSTPPASGTRRRARFRPPQLDTRLAHTRGGCLCGLRCLARRRGPCGWTRGRWPCPHTNSLEGLLGNVAFQAPNVCPRVSLEVHEPGARGGYNQLPSANVADQLAPELGLEGADAGPWMVGQRVARGNTPEVEVP